jgi:hypothetical protein
MQVVPGLPPDGQLEPPSAEEWERHRRYTRKTTAWFAAVGAVVGAAGWYFYPSGWAACPVIWALLGRDYAERQSPIARVIERHRSIDDVVH